MLSQVLITLSGIALLAVIVEIVMRRTGKASMVKTKNPFFALTQTNARTLAEPTKQKEGNEVLKPQQTQEVLKQRINLLAKVVYTLLFSGAIALLASVIFSSTVLAFIGLSLLFWGTLLLFIRPTRYVKASILDYIFSSLTSIEKIVADLNYKGKAIYLPPRYLRSVKGGIIFIPFEKGIVMPSEKAVAEEKVFVENPKGICLVPLGVGLANLYEKELGKDFVKVDLSYVLNNLPKLLVRDLEIAENLEMSTASDMVYVRIRKPFYTNAPTYAPKASNIFSSIDHPLSSSIACALSRAAGKPVVVEKTEFSNDGKTLEVCYRIIER